MNSWRNFLLLKILFFVLFKSTFFKKGKSTESLPISEEIVEQKD
jgi:hypothetical protein